MRFTFSQREKARAAAVQAELDYEAECRRWRERGESVVPERMGFIVNAALAALSDPASTEDAVINGRKLSPWELHTVRIAVVSYYSEVVTGERTIMTDQDVWIRSLEAVCRYLYGKVD